MRTTITVDKQLWEEAVRVTSVSEKNDLAARGLKALIDQAARRQAIALGGTMPDLEVPPRRKLTTSAP